MQDTPQDCGDEWRSPGIRAQRAEDCGAISSEAPAMEDLLNALTFAGLLAAQFLAVVFVSREGRRISYDEGRAKLSSPETRWPPKLGKEIWQ